MIQQFFGFSEPPFSNTPDPAFFFPTFGQKKALDSLLLGVRERKGFLLLTGDVGTGKTTLCRTLLRRLDKRVDTALVLNSDLSEVEILRAILREFGLSDGGHSKHALMERLYAYLVERAAGDRDNPSGRTALIVIDEAQNLPPRSLEQVRMISNFETEKEKLVQILLVGQPELVERLDLHSLRQVKQRVAVREHLQPLREGEVQQYVAQRLFRACGSRSPEIFTRKALRAIHRESGGFPRTVNTLCDRLLTEAHTHRCKTIDRAAVREAAISLGLRHPPLARAREKMEELKWVAAASLAFVVCAAALIYIPLVAESSASNSPDRRLMEKRFAAMESTLSALDRKFENLNVPGPAVPLPDVSSLGPREQPQDAEKSAPPAKREPGLKERTAIPKQRPHSEDEVKRFRKEIGQLKMQILQYKEKNRAMARNLLEKDRRLTMAAAEEKEIGQLKEQVSLYKEKNKALTRNLREKNRRLMSAAEEEEQEEALRKLQTLQNENSALQEQRRALERKTSKTISNQSIEIERLSLEREKLLKTLKSLSDGTPLDPDGETTMLAPSPR